MGDLIEAFGADVQRVRCDVEVWEPEGLAAWHSDLELELGAACYRTKRLREAIELVVKGHSRLMPGVPLVGWDVAMTDPEGTLLLEANLSCNFFRASLDRQQYYSFVGEAIGWLERKMP